MKKYLNLLSKASVFNGIRHDELIHMLNCLDAKVSEYKKGNFIWVQGDTVTKVAVVLSGKVNIIKEDIMGNRSLVASIEPPNVFGESLVCANIKLSPVSTQAAVDSTILTIDFLQMITTCESSCAFHTQLIQNMMKIMAQKNIYLNEKINYLNRPTTRSKISAYLANHITDTKKLIAEIPLNREELADYLGVNRSALSRELSKMRKEKLIEFNKNIFTILDYNGISELAL